MEAGFARCWTHCDRANRIRLASQLYYLLVAHLKPNVCLHLRLIRFAFCWVDQPLRLLSRCCTSRKEKAGMSVQTPDELQANLDEYRGQLEQVAVVPRLLLLSSAS